VIRGIIEAAVDRVLTGRIGLALHDRIDAAFARQAEVCAQEFRDYMESITIEYEAADDDG
jgi:hypothetical protein